VTQRRGIPAAVLGGSSCEIGLGSAVARVENGLSPRRIPPNHASTTFVLDLQIDNQFIVGNGVELD
jgi:hypothetical protein